MYTLLSNFGARLSNSIPKKGRDPSRSMVNLREGWVELRASRKWPAVTVRVRKKNCVLGRMAVGGVILNL